MKTFITMIIASMTMVLTTAIGLGFAVKAGNGVFEIGGSKSSEDTGLKAQYSVSF